MRRAAAGLCAALLASGCAGAPARPAPADPRAGAAEGPRPAAAEGHAPRKPDAAADTAPRPGGARDDARAAGPTAPSPGADATSPAPAPSPGADVAAPAPAPAPRDDAADALRARVLEAARRRLGTRPRLDCSGYVLAALAAAGVKVELRPARSRSESLHRASRPVTHPRPGDLAFFHDTYDRDRNRRRGDRFTHVALVEAVDGSAITLLHRGGRRVERIRMDLSRPSDPAANDPVRPRRRRDPPGTRYLSGELFAAFGGLLPPEVTPMLQARRGRDTPARHPATR